MVFEVIVCPTDAIPAQLTAMCKAPKVSTHVSMAALTAFSSVTSREMNLTFSAPTSLIISSAFSSLRSQNATLHPAATNCLTVSAPSPEAPPVTNATNPSSFILDIRNFNKIQ